MLKILTIPKLIFTLIVIFFLGSASAQTSIKITQNSLKDASIDSLKSGFSLYQNTHPAISKEYLKVLLHRVSQENIDLKTYKIHFQLAKMYTKLRKKDSALYHIDNSIKEVENNEEFLSSYLYFKGVIYYEFGDYTKATDYYTRVYEIAKRKNDLSTLASLDNNIALIKTQIGQNTDALQLIKKNIPFYEDMMRKKEGKRYATSYINSLMTISDIYTNLYIDKRKNNTKLLDSAHYYNTIAIEKCLRYEDDIGFAISLRLKGIIHHEEGKIEKSTADLIKAEDLIQSLGLTKRLLILYLYRGKNYFVKGDYEKALSYFQKTETLIQETEADFPDLQELYILMAKSYKQKNDSQNTIKYYNLFDQQDARNDFLNQQTQEKLYEKYDIVTFKNSIKTLENNLKQNNYKYNIILAFVLLFVVCIIIYYKYKQRQNTRYFQKIVAELELKKEKKSSSKELNISQENVLKILKGLEEFEKNKLFLKKNCSLNFVAKRINSNSTYLSKVIQIHKQKKFIQYITDLRIDYALETLAKDKKFRAYNIKSIASELGYNSAESFSKDFKKRTKLYPSYYIKKINKTM